MSLEQAPGNQVRDALRHGAGEVRLTAGADREQVAHEGPSFDASNTLYRQIERLPG